MLRWDCQPGDSISCPLSAPQSHRTSHRIQVLRWDCQPGDCIIFDSYSVHGAPGNRSSNLRRRAYATRRVLSPLYARPVSALFPPYARSMTALCLLYARSISHSVRVVDWEVRDRQANDEVSAPSFVSALCPLYGRSMAALRSS